MNTFINHLIHILVGSVMIAAGGGVLLIIHWTFMNLWQLPAAVFVIAFAWLLGYMYYELNF